MSDEIVSFIKEYAANPVNNYEMENPTVQHYEWNIVCWDSIEVFLKIENDVIKEFSFAGNTAMVSTAAASLIAEIIQWKTLDEVLGWDYGFMKEQGFEVSTRRKMAAVLPLVAISNAIHKYRQEDIKVEFDDLLKGY